MKNIYSIPIPCYIPGPEVPEGRMDLNGSMAGADF